MRAMRVDDVAANVGLGLIGAYVGSPIMNAARSTSRLRQRLHPRCLLRPWCKPATGRARWNLSHQSEAGRSGIRSRRVQNFPAARLEGEKPD